MTYNFTYILILAIVTIIVALVFKINKLSIPTTRRLSIGLIASAGALLFSAFDLFGVGVTTGDKIFATKIATSIKPLIFSIAFGFLSLIFTEMAEHPHMPEQGHPRSKVNFLESAFVYLSVLGLSLLIYGAYKLTEVVTGY